MPSLTDRTESVVLPIMWTTYTLVRITLLTFMVRDFAVARRRPRAGQRPPQVRRHAMHGSAQIGSVSLLRAAFSHNAFGKDVDGIPGGYRRLVDEHRVAGSIRQEQPRRRTGQQRRPAHHRGHPADTVSASTTATRPPPALHDLLADKFVIGHGDVHTVAVANAVLQNKLRATRA